MSDYPDPDEEYELMYADELELMQEQDALTDTNVVPKSKITKRSLDFSNHMSSQPAPSTLITKTTSSTETPVTPNEDADTETIINSQSSVILQPMEEAFASNKRTADELFGDIEDIDFDDKEMPNKRFKSEEENDLELINKIIEGRRLRQLLVEPSNRLQGTNKLKYDVKGNMSYNIPRWAFVPLTNFEGDRIYIRLESEESWENNLNINIEQPSLHAMYANAWEEARKILEKKQERLIENENTEEVVTIEEDMETKDAQLWVDKYRPQSYVDLLSEEPVNRALLHWLHLWDKIVFKKEVKTKDPQQRNSFVKRTGQFQLFNKWKGKTDNEPELDEDGRPHHKVALLCGPPGVGKTTLAHLLAKLAGYRPVEINASDERSTDAFRTALQSATLMRSVLDAEKRPNCLILDEIDGAPLPTIELLVKWCTAAIDSGKKKTKSQPLRRPVIAICNDLYATSLRPLRAVALLVRVGGASVCRLSARLAAVCAREGLLAAPHVLTALATRAQGDVRAAIQVLSFIKARARAQLKVEDVENAAIGTKDCNKTLMQALQAVFTIDDKEPEAILKIVQAAGEYDRIADGIFENYMAARVDARMLIACETLSWLRLLDAISSWTMRTQNYSLYGALSLCIARCHRVLASRAPQRVKFPTQAQEAYRKKLELESIVNSVWRGSVPSVALSRNSLKVDVLPLLPYLLSPSLRTANVQLCSESERRSLGACAGALCDYGLRYVQQRTADGLYAFVLEPDINRLAFYGNEDRVRPPPAVRQAIARAQQLEIIRRNEEMTGRAPSTATSDSKKPVESKKPATTMREQDAAIPNHMQRLKPKEVTKSTPQVHKDFFGRIVPLSQVKRQDALPDVISSSSVFYQYREGFNNAVRRKVRLRDLL
ncbi:chromosome transmission fidelity protein 18 homolog [Bombyx mandarina]|uniref:Chromosome transmission fidelity protein 18 homolog n=1 Tax=Bombyx mandarina TaxID=7092 RepID=A0A6J2KIP0_BOMMA|nr:chromosome transmission fidelity protein 18 homolog [Bombyx mandarina]